MLCQDEVHIKEKGAMFGALYLNAGQASSAQQQR